jgi:hypothetical protein
MLKLIRQADTAALAARGLDLNSLADGIASFLVNKTIGRIQEVYDRRRVELENEMTVRTRPRKNLMDFSDGLDGAWEDIDRLAGYVLEYRTAGQAGLSIHSYRETLTLPDCPMDRALVFFWPEEPR